MLHERLIRWRDLVTIYVSVGYRSDTLDYINYYRPPVFFFFCSKGLCKTQRVAFERRFRVCELFNRFKMLLALLLCCVCAPWMPVNGFYGLGKRLQMDGGMQKLERMQCRYMVTLIIRLKIFPSINCR